MVLDEICEGDFCPYERVRPTDPAYDEEAAEVCAMQNELSTKLSKQDQELLEKIIVEMQNVNCMENKAYFKMGFALGLDLQKDVQQQLSVLE